MWFRLWCAAYWTAAWVEWHIKCVCVQCRFEYPFSNRSHWIVDQIEYFKSKREKKRMWKKKSEKRQTNRWDHDYMCSVLEFGSRILFFIQILFHFSGKSVGLRLYWKMFAFLFTNSRKEKESIAWDEFEYISSILVIYAIYAYSQTRQCPIVGPWIMTILCASLGKRVVTWRIPCILSTWNGKQQYWSSVCFDETDTKQITSSKCE